MRRRGRGGADAHAGRDLRHAGADDHRRAGRGPAPELGGLLGDRAQRDRDGRHHAVLDGEHARASVRGVDRVARDQHHVAQGARPDLHPGEHAGLQEALGVRDRQAHAVGARGRIDRVAHRGDLRFERRREALDVDARGVPGAHQEQLALRDRGARLEHVVLLEQQHDGLRLDERRGALVGETRRHGARIGRTHLRLHQAVIGQRHGFRGPPLLGARHRERRRQLLDGLLREDGLRAERASPSQVGLELAALRDRQLEPRLGLAQREAVRLRVDLEEQRARLDPVAFVDVDAQQRALHLGADAALAARLQGAGRRDRGVDGAAPHRARLDLELRRRIRLGGRAGGMRAGARAGDSERSQGHGAPQDPDGCPIPPQRLLRECSSGRLIELDANAVPGGCVQPAFATSSKPSRMHSARRPGSGTAAGSTFKVT
jgi:hypothetical protein